MLDETTSYTIPALLREPKASREVFNTIRTVHRRISHRASVARFLAKNAERLLKGWL
jgi:hypothetical protein